MLALIAGQGDLPRAVAQACDRPPLVCALRPFQPDGLDVARSFEIERLGSFLTWLRRRGVTRICLCGRVSRPEIHWWRLDLRTLLLLPRIRRAIARGDDGALRIVIGILEEAGFDVVGAHEVAPSLLLPAGVPTLAQPGPEASSDVALALRISVDQGLEDLGQACVIREGRVLVREDARGTDAMLADLPEAGHLSGGLFWKGPKPMQDRRADLPVVGPATARAVVRAGLSGMVVEAGAVMVLEQDEVIRILNDAGRYLWVRKG